MAGVTAGCSFILTGFITAEMRRFPTRGLYVITDCDRMEFPALLEKTKCLMAAGISVLQYRDKNTAAAARQERALALRELCRRYNTVFLVNDDVMLARSINADGVHIGRDDPVYREARGWLGVSSIIGVSCYNRLDLAEEAAIQGADYVAFGDFFGTTTKTGTVTASPELLRQARKELTVPIVAIGGITPENGGELLQAGADLLAVISAVYAAADAHQAVLDFQKLFQ
jgi:thiamine-phosphate pyrophosphorylase